MYEAENIIDEAQVSAARSALPEGEVYADWAACALCTPTHAPSFVTPHHATSETADAARAAIRHYVNDSHHRYHVVFTSGTTAALQLLAYRLPWASRHAFVAHRHVHDAVLGLRNVAVARGATFLSIGTPALAAPCHPHQTEQPNQPSLTNGSVTSAYGENREPFAVLAYPGECNVTGAMYPLEWAATAKRHGIAGYSGARTITIVDTAKLFASRKVSLDEHSSIDAAVFSAYKICGLSCSGLGALLIRRGSLLEQLLHDTAEWGYFGGQSTDALTPFSTALCAPAVELERVLAPGTPNVAALAALPMELAKIGVKQAEVVTTKIGKRFRGLLLDAFPETTIYGDVTNAAMGVKRNLGTTAFTLRLRTGAAVGHGLVGAVLQAHGIHVRVGGMCNVSATATVLGWTDGKLHARYERSGSNRACADGPDMIDGRPTGTVRVSFGWASTVEDANTIVNVLRAAFGSKAQPNPMQDGGVLRPSETTARVFGLRVYPIRACGGMRVASTTFREGCAMGDRAYGVNDAFSAKAVLAREHPGLARITAGYEHTGGLQLWMAGKRIQATKASVNEALSQAAGRPAVMDKLRGYKNDALIHTRGELERVAREANMKLEDVITALRPSVILDAMWSSARIREMTPLSDDVAKWTRLRKCTRCATVNAIAAREDRQPLRAVVREAASSGCGFVLGAVMRGCGELAVGDQLHILFDEQ